ncbi:SCAR, putative isoform 2 [Hibiscus syriacus]|uniref:Protein SCAR n=1 Tax=Hibiscus syriacus TaxID=106335 RepID=A0A6A2X967_HIBSY|nr:SCAR, putative isoform 2 [Hibiscus syriacus]
MHLSMTLSWWKLSWNQYARIHLHWHAISDGASGVDWHPNLRNEHNLITHGDLPRCVLDSYEECRGPPRLFLLDKFDVAGAGACLKRYTDPSFFKAESDFPGVAPLEVQREKKALKKKGSRWKNGEAPEFPLTSHAKLHQLFLEKHIENAYNDPALLVKLKRRQLNESALDSKSGRTYMEIFRETSPEQNKADFEISGTLPLSLTVDNSPESVPETLDISTVSPVKVSSQGKETLSSSPTVHENVLKPSLDELNDEAIDREIMKVPERTVAFRDGIRHSLHKVTTEEEIILDGEGIEECNRYGDHSNSMTSEADNFIDAISTMESEMDTDNEYRPKDGIDFDVIGKFQTDTPSDGEVATEVFPLNRNCVTEIVEARPIKLPTCLEMPCPSSDQTVMVEKYLDDSSEKQATLITLSAESYPVDELNCGDTNASSNALPRLLNVLEVAPEKGKQPIHLVSEVSDATVEVDVNLECITPVVDTSQICDFNEQQFSDILHDDPKVEADVTGIDASYSEQKQNVDEIFYAAEGEETRKFTCSGNVLEEDAIPCNLPYDCTDDLNPKDHVDLDDLATENVCAGSIAVSTATCDSANFCDDVDKTIYHSSNLICSLSGKLMNLEEPLAGDGDIFHEGLESKEVVPQECLTQLEMQEETNQVVGTPADIDSTKYKPVSYRNLNLEDEVHYSLQAETIKDCLNFVGLTTVPASSEFSDKESESKYSSHLMESRGDTVPSPTYYQSEKENSLEKCLQTSFEHSKEGTSSQPSLDFSEQSGRQDKQESYPSDVIHPALCLHPEATKDIMEEMPPLPPLPPMQWRIGRVQHVFTGPQRELVEHGQGSLPIIPQYGTGERAQFGLPASEQGSEQPRNPFLPLVDSQERSGNAPDQLAADFMQPSPLSMNPATMASNSNSHYSLPMQPSDVACTHIPLFLHGETANCPDQFVVDTSLEGGAFQERKQHFDPEHRNPPDVSVPLPTKTEQTPAKEETPNAIVQLGLEAPEGEASPINTTLEHNLSISEGEAAWPSNKLALVQVAEEGKSNVNPPVKLPRPRNPLIDAVSAQDKSKLRKVTEQNRPPILPKVDERDSLLERYEQRLDPSFDLKPAAVTRPRVHGRKTNIRVAAILEKANAIRQALAGSDEDDDEDGWSDS